MSRVNWRWHGTRCFQLHEFWSVEAECQGGTTSMWGSLIFTRIANLFIWIWSITRNWSARSSKFVSLSYCNCRSKFSISLSVKPMLMVHQRHEQRHTHQQHLKTPGSLVSRRLLTQCLQSFNCRANLPLCSNKWWVMIFERSILARYLWNPYEFDMAQRWGSIIWTTGNLRSNSQ